MNSRLPRTAFALGLSGLLPQAATVAATFVAGYAALAPMIGYFYAVLIFSFLGGLWWGVAATHSAAPIWIYAVAVAPSLIAFASGGLWLVTQRLSPSLVVVGCGLLLSPVVDWRLRALGLVPYGWLPMRLILSVGLGSLTLLLALKA